ncbi:MAG: ATP-dependent DNA helicase RecG [Clostridiales bacterium]|jgi:ATP-dependent DNA helicase RecG|nr:ATP-dependent DNA helicase RecG [Clostridiales bacterium]
MASLFEIEIQQLKGVGEKRAQLFQKLGVSTVGALLRFYPRTYEDWSHPCSIAEAPFDKPCCIQAAVASRISETRVRKGMTLYKFRVCDGLSVMHITIFNNRYAPNLFQEGKEFFFYGKVGGTFTHREMSAPLFEPAQRGPRIRPIYSQTEGLTSRQIENAVHQAFERLPDPIRDDLPAPLRERYHLLELRDALKAIHFPYAREELEQAKRRFVFEELLILQLGLLRLKSRRKSENRMRLSNDVTGEFFSLLPFSPTGAQRRAVGECIRDMQESPSPMNRLIQGDVGSGKTAVASALCYCMAKNGWQTAFMAPTEILAAQHHRSLASLLASSGIRVELLTGSTSAAAKRALAEDLAMGRIHVIIGTHALLSEGVRFASLGLVITDEQHRFGVGQRAALAAKGDNPHLLVMSATPIPRTLALMIYGDLDVSVLDELPPGRQTVDTFWVDSGKRQRAFQFVKNHLNTGRQAYIVCPLVEEGEGNLAAAQQYFDQLQKEDFSGYSVGLLHGKMKNREKDQIMDDFTNGRIQLLVSTTVVEVGVDVPNAAVMLIENAERFGLSQLHQLRGRVGRGKHKSYCVLISDAQNEETKRRLGAMCRTNNGFEIAEEDLKLRGPGDFFGARQHGLPDLKIADMMTDMETLLIAQEEARKILIMDPELTKPEHRGLRAEMFRLFGQVGEGGFN